MLCMRCWRKHHVCFVIYQFTYRLLQKSARFIPRLSDYECRWQHDEHTLEVRLHVEEDFCDRLASLSATVPLSSTVCAPRWRWPLDRCWSRPSPDRGAAWWLPPWPCRPPAPSRCCRPRSVDGFPPPPPPPSGPPPPPPPPRRWGEKDPLGGETEPGLLRVRFCRAYQCGRLSSTDASVRKHRDQPSQSPL